MRSDILVNIKLMPGGRAPEYKTAGAAAMDLYAKIDAVIAHPRVCLEVGSFGDLRAVMRIYSFKMPCGFAIELPEGLEAQIRGRSGRALDGILAHVGTIDSDYRGEVSAILFNMGRENWEIKAGDRVAHMVIAPVHRAHLMIVDELGKTERGENGYGSTGR